MSCLQAWPSTFLACPDCLPAAAAATLSCGAPPSEGYKMYQSLALAPNPGQSAYSHDSSNFLHSPASPAVYVPTSRVPSMLQSLPYLQSCESAHQSHPLSSHPGWAQTAGADASHFNASSPHPPSGFSYSHSPPGGSGAGRDGGYQSPLLLGAGGRDQYGNALVRSVNGSYSSPYPGAYVSPAEMAPSWTAGHFESSVLHSFQTRQGTLPGRRSTFVLEAEEADILADAARQQ
ncbi:hypothetical protein lerEdw1_002133 [Lerista edwardsae]|nr:hypothetical protein lerEdw1_002133 [Lerista edwardsae]